MFTFVVNLVIFTIVASLIFFIMSTLNIRINIDIVYKPIYTPMTGQMLAISIAQSDASKQVWNYLEGKTDGKDIEETINKIIQHYKIVVDSSILGNKDLVGKETNLEILGEQNKKIEMKVVV